MTRTEIETALAEFLQREVLLRPEPIDAEEDLFDAGFDSLSLSRVLVFCEQRFGLVIPDHEVDVDQMATLAKMSAFVAARLGAPAA